MTITVEKEQTVNEPILQKDASNGGIEPLRVCFVCTGNTCRSPMAAAVANALALRIAKENGNSESSAIVAASAGLYAMDGDPIAEHAVEALELAEIEAVAGRDYHLHTAHTLTAEEAERYDLLVGLGAGHCMELLMRFPQVAQRIVGMPNPIADPFGGDLEVYRLCLRQITDGVRALLFSSYESEEETRASD